MTLDDLELP